MKTLKALTLSAAMAALMLSPMAMNAQYKEDQYGLQEWGQTSLLGKQGSGGTEGIGLGGATTENPTEAPVGGGIAILVVAGVGYTLLKRKEDMQ